MVNSDPSSDAGVRLLTKAKNASTWTDWTRAYTGFGRESVNQFNQVQAPITRYIIWTAFLLFSIESSLYIQAQDSWITGILTVLMDLDALRGVNAYFFINYPWIAWPLTEFLHRGIGHFVANVLGLAIFGKIVEPKIKKRYFLLWFLGVALIATPVHAYAELATSTEEVVAVYGMSDFVYSLGFFSTIYLIRQENRTEFEYLAILVGIAGVIQVTTEVLLALWMLSIDPVNPGHLVGGLIGIFIYIYLK